MTRAGRHYARWCRYVARYPWWRRTGAYHRARHAAWRHKPNPQFRKAVRRRRRDSSS